MKASLCRLILACLTFIGAGPTSGQELAPIDAQEIRKVIEQQLDAFAADDAERAFSFASPMIRKLFGSPERFIGMVRRGYPVVYRPAAVAFLRPEVDQGEVRQDVQMQDSAGNTWIARYRMQRQSDRMWRINGVDLAPAKGRAI